MEAETQQSQRRDVESHCCHDKVPTDAAAATHLPRPRRPAVLASTSRRILRRVTETSQNTQSSFAPLAVERWCTTTLSRSLGVLRQSAMGRGAARRGGGGRRGGGRGGRGRGGRYDGPDFRAAGYNDGVPCSVDESVVGIRRFLMPEVGGFLEPPSSATRTL
ncbi:hypothetical protein GQ600_15681 [Phytophthora cactorum]|nr:hypothetical protein GQ600_15681 [Phytophthora cactorum]